MISRTNVERAVPETSKTVEVAGLYAPVRIYRDAYGIPHAQATTMEDAFFAQGFFTAQDRLWHMDYDRHRAYGRWSEMAGITGLEQDRFMRRLRLEASARADYASVNSESRAMLDAYAAGVNAFVEKSEQLPVEYQLLNASPEAWQPWDGLAVFKVRHVLMGTFEGKAWRHKLLGLLGPRRTARLNPGYQPGHLLILPPGAEFMGEASGALEELERGAALADRLKEMEQGSNHWTLSGQLTESGKPLLAGDPHRGLDTPNVYYQNHVACPDFDVVGVSFPGVPGFPHFGHNQRVSWGVTHTGADYQDLFVERFDKNNPSYYQYKGQWRRAETFRETIKVQGSATEEISITVTHHGPVISGGPSDGVGIALRYTQTAEPNQTAEALLKMLRARSAAEIDQSMEQWVDPVNNFLFADVEGNIGYLTRGTGADPVQRERLAARAGLDGGARMAGKYTLRRAAPESQPGDQLHRHRQPEGGGTRLSLLHRPGPCAGVSSQAHFDPPGSIGRGYGRGYERGARREDVDPRAALSAAAGYAETNRRSWPVCVEIAQGMGRSHGPR